MQHMPPRHSGRSPIINVMASAIQKAARGLVRDYGELEHLQVSRKGLGDFVTAADQRSERILVEALSKARPDYAFLTEESGVIQGQGQSEYTWIIDPLDGTMNFLHGFPHFCINVGLRHQNEIIAAITYDPLRDEMFWAEKGQGAFLNQRRLRVASRQNFDQALVTTCFTHQETSQDASLIFNKVQMIASKVGSNLRTGSCALDFAYLAAGRLDGVCTWGMKPWDIGAGILLAMEAGAIITTHQTQKDLNALLEGNLIGANIPLQKLLLELF